MSTKRLMDLPTNPDDSPCLAPRQPGRALRRRNLRTALFLALLALASLLGFLNKIGALG